MKKLSKIFFAVAALAVGFSCTTDTTEDLGVELKGQTTLTLSLEESRTQLGEAVAGIYPVTWSYGDEISVNGVKSSSIEILENGTSAKFTFGDVLSYPYAIAYPAAQSGKVVFADVQPQIAGTFTNGAAAMYGYAESAGAISLKHLTGILKFGVTGSTAISRVQISTVDRKPIAGEFELNFATGELTPTENAKYTIDCTFEESADGDAGMVLSSTPYYFHFAVPAGEYNELYVTIYENSGSVMYATIKAGDTKPLVAGNVREFSNTIAYKANADLFVIYDKASLKQFASEAATLDKDAVVVDDIDMTGESWAPIEGYSKHLIGNGHAIKGLTAPLFGKTNASIKGLHLVDVNINETQNPNVGAFARQISASDTVSPTFENCTASGKITVNCQDYVYKAVSVYHEFTVGGLIGTIFGTQVNNCSSSVEIDIKQSVAQSNTSQIQPGVGGCLGAIIEYTRTDSSIVLSNVSHLSNSGDIKIANGSYNGTIDYVRLSVGGVIGITFKSNRTCTVEYLDNSGDITFDATFSKYDTRIGGVIGFMYGLNVSHCTNSGNITINSGAFYYLYCGGIVAYSGSSSIVNDAHNTGAIYMKKEVTQIHSLVLGGAVGYQQNDDATGTGDFNNVINDGAITIEANMPENTDYNYFRIGGIAGWSQCENNNNTNNGAINISGSLYNAHSSAHSMCVAGIVGYKTVDAVKDVENNGDITISAPVGYAEGSDCRLYVAGITGYGVTVVSNAKNTGDIEISGATQGYLGVGGIAGWFGNQITNIENTGNIKVKVTSIKAHTYISGCIAATTANPETGYILSNFINRGSINIEADSCKGLWLGGCLGFWSKQVAIALRAAENYGPITVKTTASHTEVRIGGIIGYLYGTSNSRGLHNHKSATINVDVDVTGGMLAVGGIASGLRDALDPPKSGEPANGNDADIFVTGSTKTTFDVGGIITTANNYNRYNATNNGNITITGATVGTDLRVGGIECSRNYGAKNINYVNNGDVFIDSTTKVQGSVSVGGFAGGNGPMSVASAQTYEGCSNTGDITFSGEAGLSGTGSVRMGGLNSAINGTGSYDGGVAFVNGFTNSGNITYNGKLHSTDGKVAIGGIIGEYMLNSLDNSTWTGEVVNTGNITCTGTHNGTTYVGGIFGETNKSFANGKVNCSIYGAGYNNVGMVLGVPRVAEVTGADGTVTTPGIIASNFMVGGKITYSLIGEDADGNPTSTETEVVLNADNWMNYIYGSATDWTGTDNYDGCSFLSVVPEV